MAEHDHLTACRPGCEWCPDCPCHDELLTCDVYGCGRRLPCRHHGPQPGFPDAPTLAELTGPPKETR